MHRMSSSLNWLLMWSTMVGRGREMMMMDDVVATGAMRWKRLSGMVVMMLLMNSRGWTISMSKWRIVRCRSLTRHRIAVSLLVERRE